MSATYVPDRGDLVWLQFEPQAGHEQGGRRPAMAISPAAYNGRVGLGIFCPITRQTKGYPFEVAIPDHLATSGVVLADQVRTLDWKARQAEWIERAPPETVDDVLQRLLTLVQPA